MHRGGGQAGGGGLVGWRGLAGSFLGPSAATGHQQGGRGLCACRVDVRPQRCATGVTPPPGSLCGPRGGPAQPSPAPAVGLTQVGRAHPGSHWILKSGGSSLMLETAMWPVSPSSNSTTTESRSSSSLELPEDKARLSAQPGARGSPSAGRMPGGAPGRLTNDTGTILLPDHIRPWSCQDSRQHPSASCGVDVLSIHHLRARATFSPCTCANTRPTEACLPLPPRPSGPRAPGPYLGVRVHARGAVTMRPAHDLWLPSAAGLRTAGAAHPSPPQQPLAFAR